MGALVEETEDYIVAQKLFSGEQRLLLGVSGGMDSMVLLHVLHRLAEKHRWQITLAHLNHQLRGRSSNADQRLVERTARQLKLELVTERADVRAMAARSKGSIEMAARRVRHEFLARVAKENDIGTIALAHHADDQVELFFLRLLRGAGADGLAGMQPLSTSPVDDQIKLVRPLLGLTRGEIEDYAQRERIKFREDASNRSIDYLRNRVRHKLLPLLEGSFQPALREVILRTMEVLAAEADCSGQAATEWLANRGTGFDQLHVAVQRRVLQLQLIGQEVPPDFNLVEWLRRNPEKPCSIGTAKHARRDKAGQIAVTRASPQFSEDGIEVDLKTAIRVHFDDLQISARRTTVKVKPSIVRKPGIERFDADAIGDRLVLRHWRKGDRFQPIGMSKEVKLQDLFINAKVPREERHQRLTATTA
ncbi:MAG TPA: tRNA lysidine(34) synthetase TilS, partial [Candidatus Binatia bacterium]|nr:tRNA lysidine(34) synthetase TilS [Candidatus Binatia bacterium]